MHEKKGDGGGVFNSPLSELQTCCVKKNKTKKTHLYKHFILQSDFGRTGHKNGHGSAGGGQLVALCLADGGAH